MITLIILFFSLFFTYTVIHNLVVFYVNATNKEKHLYTGETFLMVFLFCIAWTWFYYLTH